MAGLLVRASARSSARRVRAAARRCRQVDVTLLIGSAFHRGRWPTSVATQALAMLIRRNVGKLEAGPKLIHSEG